MQQILSSPEAIGLITSIIGLIVGYVARMKGLTLPSKPDTPATPTTPPLLPNLLPNGIPTEPLDLLRLGLELLRKRRTQAKAEEAAFAKVEGLFSDIDSAAK